MTSIISTDFHSTAELEVMLAMYPSPHQEQLLQGLLGLQMKVYLAQSPEDALMKLQTRSFHIVILEEGYSMEIMQLMAAFPGSIRRNIFYIFVGESIETGNMMQSYVLSANLVVNYENIDGLAGALPSWLAENNNFFRLYQYMFMQKQGAV